MDDEVIIGGDGVFLVRAVEANLHDIFAVTADDHFVGHGAPLSRHITAYLHPT